jgi:hypothetical protein
MTCFGLYALILADVSDLSFITITLGLVESCRPGLPPSLKLWRDKLGQDLE